MSFPNCFHFGSYYVFYKGSTSVAGALCYEAGYKLNQLERFGESLWFLERAVHKWQSSIIFQVECLLLLAKSQVSCCFFSTFIQIIRRYFKSTTLLCI